MKVALNAMQAGNRSGTGVYASQLARWLPRVSHGISMATYWPAGLPLPDAAIADTFKNVTVRGGLRRIAYDQFGFAREAAANGADLLHYPATVGRLLPSRNSIVTIHDLTFLHEPEWYGWEHAAYLKYATWLSARHARRIVTVSEATKRDVVELLRIPESKVDAIPNGVDESFVAAEEDEVERVAAKYKLPDLFVLFVGTLEPRKNIVRLIQAFSKAADAIPHHLVIAGRNGWIYHSIHEAAAASRHAARVHFIGHAPPEDLPALYSAADMFAFPSLFEGFGIPVAEAMACGTPVLTSTTSSLPEVAGDAAVLVDPYDVEAIATGMTQILSDERLKARLHEAGPIRARQFSWKRTAECVVESYKKAME
ncbi:MAG: glycosyl transferase [Candidatus Hydrogenedentota bacterium]